MQNSTENEVTESDTLRELIKERETGMENSQDTEFDKGFLQGIDACIEIVKRKFPQ